MGTLGFMPRTTSGREIENISVRYSPELGAWLRTQAERRAVSLNEVFRDLAEDAKTWFGLPSSMVELLEEDRKHAKKADLREYVVELLVRRYNELLGEQPATSKKRVRG